MADAVTVVFDTRDCTRREPAGKAPKTEAG